MSKTVEFYFDFGSPTAYLAYKRLQQFARNMTSISSIGPCCWEVFSRLPAIVLPWRYQRRGPT